MSGVDIKQLKNEGQKRANSFPQTKSTDWDYAKNCLTGFTQ